MVMYNTATTHFYSRCTYAHACLQLLLDLYTLNNKTHVKLSVKLKLNTNMCCTLFDWKKRI